MMHQGRGSTVASLALIGVGGGLGTLLRAEMPRLMPTVHGSWPWSTFTVNITGALLLGMLVEGLRRAGPDVGRRRKLRLLAGTGFLGGLTTYSSFAVELSQAAGTGDLALALGYAAASVTGGMLAAALGFVLARRCSGSGNAA